MKKFLLFCTLGCALMSFSAQADTGPYVEVNFGYASTSSSTINQAQELFKQENSHFGFNANAGVLFLGLGGEAGYTRFGKIQYNDGVNSAPVDLYGLHLAAKLQQGIGPLFVMGKLGYGQLHRGSFVVNNINVGDAQTSGLYFGFGGGLKFMPTLAAVIQYQQIEGSGDVPTANLTSLGINWTL